MGNVLGDLLCHHDSMSQVAALVASTSAGSQQELQQLILDHPKMLSKQFGPDDNTLWHLLASSGNTEDLVSMVAQFKQQHAQHQNQQLQQQQQHCAVPAGTAEDAVKKVLNLANANGVTPLMTACVKGNAAAAGYLVAQGADPFRKDLRGLTALHFAARGGHAACIKAVMEGLPADRIVQTRVRLIPDPQAQTNNFMWFPGLDADSNRTVIHCLQTIKLQDVLDRSGLSPLHFAIGYNHPECVETLLKYDVSLIPRSKVFTTEMGFPLPAGSTPLHVAADRGLLDFARAITRHQTSRLAADPHSRQPVQASAVDPRWLPNSQGATPFQVAHSRRRSPELQHLLHPSTDLSELFDVRELAAPASGVPKLCYLAAVTLQAKLLFDLKLVALNAEAEQEAQDKAAAAGPPAAPAPAPAPAEGGSLRAPIERALSAELCAVCMERPPNVQVGGCTHMLCSACAEQMCRRFTGRPIGCPFCRKSIEAFKPRRSAEPA